MKFSAWYAIIVGILLFAQWVFFLATGSVPQLQTEPWAIGFHISAEMLMAVALLTGGIASLQKKSWGLRVLLVALGMAIYSEINSPGYFAQLGQWALVAMFGGLLFGAVVSIMLILQEKAA